MKYYLVALIFFLIPLFANANPDLQIIQDDIRFSKSPLIAGDQVRIYATVRNVGNEDVTGYVSFYQGATLIGSSQVISLLTGGNPEEVYVDFVVPSSEFNIRAQVEGTEPVDTVQDNNVTITQRLEPVFDDDRDGIENDLDNCVTVSNSDQKNADGDTQGDVCDDDDDNDGLSDDVEAEAGTSAIQRDSDGDGADDQTDVFPLDPDKQVIEKEVAREPVVKQQVKQEALRDIISEVAKDIQQSKQVVVKENEVEEVTQVPEAEVIFSPNVVFSYERKSWSTFIFTALGTVDDSSVYAWDFGDGSQSSKSVVEHTFVASGAYTVTLTSHSGDGISVTESTTIFVPFFTLRNPVIATAVAILSLLLIVGAGVIFSTFRKPVPRVRGSVEIREE
jgi:hypothetical protein